MSGEVTHFEDTAKFSTPDWVVLGVTVPEGVMVLASTALNLAELRYEVDLELDDPFSVFARMKPTNRTFILTARMPRFVMVLGKNYAEAMARLFQAWSPSDAPAAIDR